MVLLEEDDITLARQLGLDNLSDYVRDCIAFFISGCDRELTRSEVREISKKIALEKRISAMKQQKITAQTEEERQKIADAQQVRRDKLMQAVKTEMDRVGADRMRRYMKDENGDYHKVQEDILLAISQKTGFPVDLADVLAVTGWRL